MKKLIFQYYFEHPVFNDKRDDVGKVILPYSIKSVMAYAQRIGADHKLYTDRKLPLLGPNFEKLRALAETEYDKVLVIDTDIIIPKETSSNIFEEYKDSKLALRCSPKHLGYMSSINSGVVLWDKELMELLQQDYYDLFKDIMPRKDIGLWNDEKFIQECYMKHGFDFTPIDWVWNCHGEEFHDLNHIAYFIHYGSTERDRFIFDEKYWVDKL